MRIGNREQLLANAAEGLVEARSDALALLERALDGVEPEMLVARALRLDKHTLTVHGDPLAQGPGSSEDLLLDLGQLGAVRCIAAGKAAEGMLRGLKDTLPVQEAFGAAPGGEGQAPWPVLRAGHPLPDAGSCEAGSRALELAKATGERDLLVVLLSGGASALLEEPLVPLDDLRQVTQGLLDAGAAIEDLNAVRRKLSGLKGGRLAQAAKGQVLTLALSDCFEDHASLVGSGPTAPDPTTYGDALATLRHFKVEAPASVRALLEEGKAGQRPETPKPGDPLFRRVQNVVVGSNGLAAHEATELAVELDYNAFRVREPLRGSATRAGWKLARLAEEITLGKAALPRPAAVIFGGETAVDVRGSHGKGGRNQEACLAALEQLKVEACVAFLATDGVDGPTEAAGAIGDMGSRERAEQLGLDFRGHLSRHDSAAFFERLGDRILTGPTGTNVADLAVLLVP